MKKLVSLFILLALSLSLLTSCKSDDPKSETTYDYFNTICTIRSYNGESKAEFEQNASKFLIMLEKYHKLFDIYYEYSGVTNICTINKNAGKEPVRASRELIDLLLYSKEMYTLTNGKVNIAMGAVLKLWHDKREAATITNIIPTLPSHDDLTYASAHTDIDNLIIDEENLTVFLSDPAMSLDVGAIAKGYVAEKIAEYFIDSGITGYVIDLGGNLRTIGKKASGEGWVTGIKNPTANTDTPYVAKIKLADTACVTSGDYERYYTVGGKRYHHIIDTDTLYPSVYFSSVTIVTPDSAIADVLSTALFCMNEEEGRALLDSFADVEVMWVYHNGGISYTDGLGEILINV